MEADEDRRARGSSPYATGGGGVVLEHRYGAMLLGNLLTGDPVPELGDDASPLSVQFQTSAFSPVDDLLIVGRAPDGGERRLSIGVRRAPRFVRSERGSVGLLASYLRVATDHWEEVQAGRWRLSLAVASPNPAIQQISELTLIARGTTSETEFRSEVERPGRTNRAVRSRLGHVTDLVGAAATQAEIDADPGVLVWRLLSGLRVRELRLEGGGEADRTSAVARLRAVTRDGTVASGDRLFTQLAELAARYASTGAHVTEVILRRDLSGTPLARSPNRTVAWEMLDGLGTRLRDRTRFRLAGHGADLQLERAGALDAVAAAMEAAATGPGALVVLGEPDVGKSALTLQAAERLEVQGAAVTALSLRDLPATTVELEALTGGPLTEVLGGTAGGTGRLLLIDGAESVLEGRGGLLTEVATAALRAGLGVVAVTRADGARAVEEMLARAATAADLSGAPRRHEVPELTSSEVKKITVIFPSLARLREEPRAAWLLARPGLVDLLLRAGPMTDLPEGPLSEADLFAAVWHQLVRRGEITVSGGPSPDARDRALTSLVRRLLLPRDPGEPPDPQALPSLRSDGLLVSPGPTIAWNPSDQFSTDLVRDLSLARLLITDGWALLDEAGAPRWALRAVRIACQAALAAGDTDEARIRLQAAFDDLASRHGARWAEVPLEAMLTLGSAEEALARGWPALLASEGAGVRTLLRLALQRYTQHGFGDPVILAPLVRFAYCGGDDLGQHDRYSRRDTGETIREVVLAWLRGLVKTDAGPLPLRQQVRDRLLASSPEPYDEFAVEALAMLGPDLDEHAEAFLRDLAEQGGAHLAPAVESVGTVVAMSTHQPELLIALTEAFYVERHEDEEDGWSSDYLDEGIRHHQKYAGIGFPMAAWYFAPFFRLLNTRPVEAIGLINRILDHAAVVRVGRSPPWERPEEPSETPLPGLDLDLPGVGMRRCVGDGHVWSWYRGSSVGPYPCMSALLALERFADHLVDTLGLPLARVIELLLRDCHNLAMPGLVVGLLVRHLDRADDLLDSWLVRPEVWHLEFSRSANEGRLHVQGADPVELVGRDRRHFSFRDVAAQMTLRAMLAGDEERLAALASLGDELVQRAHEEMDGSDETTEEKVAVEGWAALFRPDNYHARESEDGGVVVEYEHPEEIATGLAPSLAALARGNDALRLQLTYAESEDRAAPVKTLMEDLLLAREFAEDPPAHGPLHPADPVAAVAAAAIVAHADGRTSVPEGELRWAAEVLIEAATRPQLDQMSYPGTIYPMGADRSAAAGLPALLRPPFDGLELDRKAISEALRHCASSLFDEVRAVFAIALTPIWGDPCDRSGEPVACRHVVALTATQEGLRDCRLGGWDQASQRRLPDPLSGPYDETLPTVEAERTLVNRLAAPLVVTADAARSHSCVRGPAKRLLEVLLDAQRRGWDHWAKKGYGHHTERWRPTIARVLVELALAGDAGPLTIQVRDFASNARALDQLLHELAVLFTYDATLRPALTAVWRNVMEAALDALEAGADLQADHHWSDYAIARLLPTPELGLADTDPDSTLEEARQSWVSPDEIADLVARWLPFARREPKAIDAVAQLARCAPLSWQVTTGLGWAEDVIDGEYAGVANRCWFLTDWLQTLRASGQLDAEGIGRWRRLVDGLAAEADSRAVSLQLAEE